MFAYCQTADGEIHGGKNHQTLATRITQFVHIPVPVTSSVTLTLFPYVSQKDLDFRDEVEWEKKHASDVEFLAWN